jgi:hypothetical protein
VSWALYGILDSDGYLGDANVGSLARLVTTALLVTGGAGVFVSPTIAAEPAEPAEPAEAPQAEFTGAVGYGISVAMSTDGSTAVVGQVGDSTFTDVPGVAHVYTSDGADWTQQAELTANDPSYDMLFGNAVAASADGNTVIVGDPGECGYGLENCEHGAAYVFTRSGSTWTQQAELHGGPGFGGTTWTQQTTLSAGSASGPFDDFGFAVALSADGGTALIGDPTQGADAGSAYVFTGSGANWTQQAELTGSDVTKGSEFGASVALSADGRTSLVGAPSPGGGSAYLFSDSDSSWIQQAELTPDDAEVTSFDGWFGASVALDGEGSIALVGAPWAEEDLGAAYAFAGEGSSWTQQGEFILDDATPYDYFGDAVALNGEGTTALIGRYDPGADFFRVAAPHFPPPLVSPASLGRTGTGSESAAENANKVVAEVAARDAAAKKLQEEAAASSKKHQEEEAAAKKKQEEAKAKATAKPPTRVQLLAKALKQCKKEKTKSKRAKCEAAVRKKYAKPKPKKKTKKK